MVSPGTSPGERSPATALYLDVNVEKTFVAARTMPDYSRYRDAGHSDSRFSRRVGALENELGVRLLQSSPYVRRLCTTPIQQRAPRKERVYGLTAGRILFEPYWDLGGLNRRAALRLSHRPHARRSTETFPLGWIAWAIAHGPRISGEALRKGIEERADRGNHPAT